MALIYTKEDLLATIGSAKMRVAEKLRPDGDVWSPEDYGLVLSTIYEVPDVRDIVIEFEAAYHAWHAYHEYIDRTGRSGQLNSIEEKALQDLIRRRDAAKGALLAFLNG